MKTLTAFLHLLFPSGRKNSRAVRNDQTPGSSTATTTKDKSIDMNDAKDYGASFLFFNQADSQQSGADSPQSTDHGEESKSKEESKRINDELALGNAKPAYRNWRDRVNDDLAACSPIVNPESVVKARESVTVISDLKNILPIITLTDKTRTNKNDAWLPFASFCFLFVGAFAKADLRQSIGQLFFKNQKPVLLTVPIRSRQIRKPNYNDGIKL